MIFSPCPKIRLLAGFCVAATLVACSTIKDASSDSESSGNSTAVVKAIGPAQAALSMPRVITEKTASQYVKDLESCRSSAAAAIGPERLDDVAPLKRALKNEITSNTLDIGYVSTDPAIRRDLLVIKCISNRGYIVK